MITQVTGSVTQTPINPMEGIIHRAEMIFIRSSITLEITGAVFCPMLCMLTRIASKTPNTGKKGK